MIFGKVEYGFVIVFGNWFVCCIDYVFVFEIFDEKNVLFLIGFVDFWC